MKITGYTQQVTNVSGSGSAPTLNASVQAKAAASDVVDMSPVAKGFGDWAKTIDAIHEQEDRQNVLAAMDDYNKQMSELLNGKNGYLNRELQGANGIVDDYAEKEKQIRQATIGSTKLFFKGNKMGLEHSLAGSAQQGFDRVLKWQQKQMDAVSDLHCDNVVATNIETAQQYYDDPKMVQQSKTNILNALSLRHQAKGSDYMEAVTRKTLGQFGVSLLEAAYARNDMSKASEIYQDYKPFMSPEQRNKYEQKAINLQLGDQQRSLIDKWLSEEISVEEAKKRIDAMDGFVIKNINGNSVPEQAEGTTWKKMNENVSLEGLYTNTRKGLDVAAKIYSELFPGEKLLLTSGMDGKHETHKGESIDVNDDFGKTILADKGNREKFKAALSAQGIRVLDEYENKTKYQTGPHLHLEFNDFKPGSATEKIHYNAKQKQELMNLFISAHNQKTNIERLDDKDFYNGIVDKAVEMVKNKIPMAQAMQELAFKQVGTKFLKAKSAVATAYSGMGLGGAGDTGEYGKKAQPLVVTKIKEMFPHAKNKAEIMAFCKEKNLSQADTNKVYIAYDQYLSGKGEYKYKWSDIKQRVFAEDGNMSAAFKEQAWGEARAYASEYIRQYVAENGKEPSDDDVIKACRNGKKQAYEIKYKNDNDFFSSKLKYSLGKLRQKGIETIADYPGDDTKCIVYFTNGKANPMNKTDIVALLGENYK